MNKTGSEKNISFRWMYIVLPAAILLLSVIVAAFFYRLLPSELVYHFTDGTPDRWLTRGAIIAWTTIPQFVFVLLALVIISVVTILSKRFWQVETGLVRKLLLIMGNMIALPQIILIFAMFDIFLYNVYQIHLPPVWVFTLIVMLLGGIILGIFFVQAFRQARGLPDRSREE
jgi:hypothetical protein